MKVVVEERAVGIVVRCGKLEVCLTPVGDKWHGSLRPTPKSCPVTSHAGSREGIVGWARNVVAQYWDAGYGRE